jgi:hypothetical protein
MLATVDSSEDQSLRVQGPAGNLAAIGKLKDTLTDFHGRTVNLVQEQDNRLGAGLDKPAKRTELRSANTVDLHKFWGRHTEKITLGHLRSTTLHNWKSSRTSKLVNHLGFTDTVTTTDQDGLENPCDVGNDALKSLEVYSHFISLSFWVGIPARLNLSN